MKRLSLSHKDGIRMLDALIWYGYLCILLVISFVNDFYSSRVWLLVSAATYLLSGLLAVSMMNGGRFNWVGLAHAKYAVVILCAMLLLLVLQIFIPMERHTDILLFNNLLFDGPAPSWFEPHSVWSIVPDKTRWLLNSEVLVFTLFSLSVALVCSRQRLKQLLLILLFVGLTHSLVGVFAKYGGIALVETKQLDGHFSAARAWFINRNHFAAFIGLCMTGALAFQLKFLMSQKNKNFVSALFQQAISYRVFYLLGLTTGVIAIILSQSRAGFLAFFFSLLLVLLIVSKRGLVQDLISGWRKYLIPVAIVTSVAMFYFGGELLQRFAFDSLLGERLDQWSLTWAAIEQSWLLGYGGNSYADVFQVHRGYLDFRQVVFNQSHNDYLHIWLEQGLLGLVLWLGLLTAIVRAAFNSISSSSSTLVVAVLISTLVAMTAALAQSFVDFNLQIVNIRVYFFVIMSLVFSAPTIVQRKSRS